MEQSVARTNERSSRIRMGSTLAHAAMLACLGVAASGGAAFAQDQNQTRRVVVEREAATPATERDEQVSIVMFKDGHKIEFSIENGTPRYKLDGEWQGKNRWRNTPGGGFMLEDAEGEPLLEFTPEQARAMGLVGGQIRPQVADGERGLRWTGQTDTPGITRSRIRVQRDGDGERVEVEEIAEVELAISTGKGVTVELERSAPAGWSVREYRLKGREMAGDAARLDDDRLLFLDDDGQVIEVIELSALEEYAEVAGRAGNPGGFPGGMGWRAIAESPAQPKVMIGIAMSEVPESLASQLGLDPDKAGVLISGVTPGMPAEKAGIRAQDVLVWLGEQRTPATFDTVREVLLKKSPGQTVELEILRGGEARRFEVQLVERPVNMPVPGQPAVPIRQGFDVPGALAPRQAFVDEASRAVAEEMEVINNRLAEVGKKLEASVRRLGDTRGQAREELEQVIGQLSLEAAELSDRSRVMSERMSERLIELGRAEALGIARQWSPRVGGLRPQVLIDENEVLLLPEVRVELLGTPAQPGAQPLTREIQREIELITDMLSERFERLTMESEERSERGDRETIERIERLERALEDHQRDLDRRLDRIERMLEQISRDR